MYLFLKTFKIGLLFPTHRRPLLSTIQEKPEKIGQGHICGSQMDFYCINEMNVEWLYPKCQTFLMEELKTIKILKLFRQVVETCYKETLRNKYARNNRRRVEKVMQGTQDSVKYPNKSDSICRCNEE